MKNNCSQFHPHLSWHSGEEAVECCLYVSADTRGLQKMTWTEAGNIIWIVKKVPFEFIVLGDKDKIVCIT